jgi:hypothetical protein
LADKINPVAVQAMAEEGIDVTAEPPKILTLDAVKASEIAYRSSSTTSCSCMEGVLQATCGVPNQRAKLASARRCGYEFPY